MLVGYFAGLKPDDAHQNELDLSTRRRHSGKHPAHIERVRKTNHKLFDNPIAAEDLG
jgi:hypothetical protein